MQDKYLPFMFKDRNWKHERKAGMGGVYEEGDCRAIFDNYIYVKNKID